MKIALTLIAGIAAGFALAHLNAGLSAQAQSPEGQYQMLVTSGASGGPFGFLLNARTGALRFCNARVENNVNLSTCFPVPNSN